jgi:L-asparaginase
MRSPITAMIGAWTASMREVYFTVWGIGRSTVDSSFEDSMIRIFVTGGTFDKDYNELTGSLVFKDTHVPEMLRLGRSRVEVSIRTLMMIDSLEMTDADRSLIVEQCRQAAEPRILITHGTDTMIETAGVLAVALGPDAGKTIVLTGAMVPYAFGSSDGLFNLGSALSFVQILPPGIYVAMNGRYFLWNQVRKNRETGVFETLPAEP